MALDLGPAPLAPPSKSDRFSPIEPIFNNNGNNNDGNYTQMSQNDDDSWEVRAFEEDTTGNLLGCTWPPRSYTCTFCRRGFRSAQALGGHMNVHRRDRARLHEPPLPPVLIRTGQEFAANGLCLFYRSLPNPSSIVFPNPTHFITNKPADTAPDSVVSSANTEPSASNSNNDDNNNNENTNRAFHENAKGEEEEEELDLELRLGRKPSPPPPPPP